MKIALGQGELQAALSHRFKATELRLLGRGAEGPVYSDGTRVFKCLLDADRWTPRKTLLRGLPERLRGYSTWPEVLEVEEVSGTLVVVSRFEPFSELGATKAEEWLAFLRESRAAGLACRNVSPKNFVRVAGGIRLVDVGSDLRDLTPGEFQEMSVRTFLSFRFGARPDLAELMRECLLVKNHPALLGLNHFLSGLDRNAALEAFEKRLEAICLALPGGRVLDYGAGPAWLAERLAGRGRNVFAYDPAWGDGQSLIGRGFTAMLRGDLDGVWKEGKDKFDLIVFSRVDCEISDDAELSDALREMRRVIRADGRLVAAMCNPFFADVRRTVSQERMTRIDPTAPTPQPLVKSVVGTGRTRRDIFRRWDRLERLFLRNGWRVVNWEELPGSDLDRSCYASEYLYCVLEPVAVDPPVSLLIKTCAMDHGLVDVFVPHLVRALEGPRAFDERVVVVDSRHDNFLRQYDTPDRAAVLGKLKRLEEEGVVDRIVEVPPDPESVRSTYTGWFGASTAKCVTDTHSRSGQQLHATLYGIDACRNDLILALDGDLIFRRGESRGDWLGDLLSVLESDPHALFVTPSIARAEDRPPSWVDEAGKPFRVDPVIALIDRARVRARLPIDPGTIVDGSIEQGWHRLFDAAIVAAGKGRAYRRFDTGFAWIHVPNELKASAEKVALRIDRTEEGVLPAEQISRIDIAFDSPGWWAPKRTERFVFVIAGRNVPIGKARRCLDSLFAQDRSDWGAIVIDDASDGELPTYLERYLRPWKDRVTLVRNRRRLGGLRNLALAVERFCANPESVIVTLDLDDALTGAGVMSRLAREYDSGADMTVGSMFGADKRRRYRPDFARPRSRGNNLWQHLRSFKKRLFDAIPRDAFTLDGEWIDEVNDWAYMVPLGEIASDPRYIKDELYYYEATGPKTPEDKDRRNGIAARILAKPPMVRGVIRLPIIAVVGDAAVPPDHPTYRLAYEVGSLVAQRGWRLITGGLGGVMEAASAGAHSVRARAPGSIIGVLPGLDPAAANPFVEIILATGLGEARNQIVANADGVIIVGGGAGTLAEVALAWSYRRPIVALRAEGWSERLADQRIDSRPRKVEVSDDRIYGAGTPEEAAQKISEMLGKYARRPKGAGSTGRSEGVTKQEREGNVIGEVERR